MVMRLAYRIDFLTHGPRIRRARLEPCSDDTEAWAMARVFLRGEDEVTLGIEIWSGARLVGAVDRDPTPKQAA